MKKLYTLILLTFVSLSGMTYAMEQDFPEGKQEEKVIPFEEIRLLSFLDPLPDEIKLPILSYVVNADTIDEAYKNIHSLLMTNKQAAALFKDDDFIKNFVDLLYSKFITPKVKDYEDYYKSGSKAALESSSKAVDLAITLAASLENNTYAKDRLNKILKESPQYVSDVIVKPLMLKAIGGHSRKKIALLMDFYPLLEQYALFNAALENNKDMVEYLVNDMKVDAQVLLAYVAEHAHQNRIHNFSLKEVKRIVDLLLEYGADINAKGDNGKTPLMLLIENYKMSWLDDESINALKEKIDYLLSKGADINAVDNEGNSVLMLAVERERFELIEFLIERGADTKIVNKKGKNAWDIAAEDDLHSDELIETLEDATGERSKEVKIKKDKK